MSKEAKYTVKIKKPDQKTLEAAIESMIKTTNAKVINDNKYHIYGLDINKQGTCVQLPGTAYPVDIYIEESQIKVHGDSMDLHRAQQLIEEFYKIQYMKQQIQTLAPTSMKMNTSYNENKQEAKLEVWY